MSTLILLLVLLVGAVLLPFFLLGLAFKVLVALAVVPLRLLGAGLRVAGALSGALAKLAACGAGLGVALVGLGFAVIIVPLLPMLLVAGALWVLFKAFEPRVVHRPPLIH